MFHFQPTHEIEWVFFSSWYKRQQQLMWGPVFLAPSSALCVLQEGVLPLPRHPSASSNHAAVFCPAYFYLLTALRVIKKKKRWRKWSSYLLSYKPPKCSIKIVWCLENVCCWSVGISLITSAVGWTTELPPAALPHMRRNVTTPMC